LLVLLEILEIHYQLLLSFEVQHLLVLLEIQIDHQWLLSFEVQQCLMGLLDNQIFPVEVQYLMDLLYQIIPVEVQVLDVTEI